MKYKRWQLFILKGTNAILNNAHKCIYSPQNDLCVKNVYYIWQMIVWDISLSSQVTVEIIALYPALGDIYIYSWPPQSMY